MTNILLITMDDMRHDEMRYMPNVRRLLLQEGTEFTRCMAQVPLCSPSRTGLLTGQIAIGADQNTPVAGKHHGVTTNVHFPGDNEYAGSVFAAIGGGAHRCGMVGKFIREDQATTIKPGFDFWRTLVNATPASPYGSYDGFQYAIHNGSAATNYINSEFQDHQLGRECMTFLAGAGNTEPWCLWFCPTQPHWPWQDPPGLAGRHRFDDFPITFEADVSDKPSWIRGYPALDAAAEDQTKEEMRTRLREVKSADQQIGMMIDYIIGTGQADDTHIIFTSDNGNLCGEHRITGGEGNRTGVKNAPYAPSLRVPCVVRGPGFAHKKVSVPTCNLDITATMLDVANRSALLPSQYGTSLALVAANPAAYTGRRILCHRNAAGSPAAPAGMPSADMIVSNTHTLIRYRGTADPDQYELYQDVNDPHQLVNRAYLGGADATVRNDLESAAVVGMNAQLA